ncbi:hypothetical protein M378DRAFT_163775 [Amanita muscaria Koide BX008]|uniref:Uncharacterized protein n=1 Tax=Amanita muscaria (strain Koide BX008) TaxID=946122 RepID=A0A0C2SLM2_AMAMK|nr:hypothetical protein M378DRAFT_163775 [Amanita muscaria Koide BX008]
MVYFTDTLEKSGAKISVARDSEDDAQLHSRIHSFMFLPSASFFPQRAAGVSNCRFNPLVWWLMNHEARRAKITLLGLHHHGHAGKTHRLAAPL